MNRDAQGPDENREEGVELESIEPSNEEVSAEAPVDEEPEPLESDPEESESKDADSEESGEEDEEKIELPLEGVVEAILFSSEIPLNQRKLAKLARNSVGSVLKAIDDLNVFYGETGRAFRIATLAEGFQMVTAPEFAEPLSHLHKEKVPTRLSKAALETLAIIAFKQPVTRAEIDAIRGVSASDRVLRNLIERKIVKIAGRAEAPGKPLLYATTREFLAYFGLGALSDLPRTDELAALLAGEITEEARRTVASDVEAELGPEEIADGAEEAPIGESEESQEADAVQPAAAVLNGDDEPVDEEDVEEETEESLVEASTEDAEFEDDPDAEPSELLEDLEELAEEATSAPEFAPATSSHSGEESDTHDESTET